MGGGRRGTTLAKKEIFVAKLPGGGRGVGGCQPAPRVTSSVRGIALGCGNRRRVPPPTLPGRLGSRDRRPGRGVTHPPQHRLIRSPTPHASALSLGAPSCPCKSGEINVPGACEPWINIAISGEQTEHPAVVTVPPPPPARPQEHDAGSPSLCTSVSVPAPARSCPGSGDAIPASGV